MSKRGYNQFTNEQFRQYTAHINDHSQHGGYKFPAIELPVPRPHHHRSSSQNNSKQPFRFALHQTPRQAPSTKRHHLSLAATHPISKQPLPFPRNDLLQRPSLIFVMSKAGKDSDDSAFHPLAFDFEDNFVDQNIMQRFTSGQETGWCALTFIAETGDERRSLKCFPERNWFHRNGDPYTSTSPSYSPTPASYSPTPPSYSPTSLSYSRHLLPKPDPPTFVHLSRYVSVYQSDRVISKQKIIVDVNECLKHVDIWVRNCQGLNVHALADIILAYYNVWDSVSIRNQDEDILKNVPAKLAWWFREQPRECALCSEEFTPRDDCLRCFPVW